MITPELEHEQRASEPMYWLNKANDLHAAAGALWYCMENQSAGIAKSLGLADGFDMTVATWPVYRMLCGMSLELAYKAVCVAQGQKVVVTHDLVRLAKLAGIAILSRADADMLAYLSECVVWDGRYPVPKSSQAAEYFAFLTYERFYRPERLGQSSFVLKPIDPHPLDWPQFQPLWEQAVVAYTFWAGKVAPE